MAPVRERTRYVLHFSTIWSYFWPFELLFVTPTTFFQGNPERMLDKPCSNSCQGNNDFLDHGIGG